MMPGLNWREEAPDLGIWRIWRDSVRRNSLWSLLVCSPNSSGITQSWYLGKKRLQKEFNQRVQIIVPNVFWRKKKHLLHNVISPHLHSPHFNYFTSIKRFFKSKCSCNEYCVCMLWVYSQGNLILISSLSYILFKM